MNKIPLPGCTPEPLMNYLKGLGVLRLASEQADAGARGSWRDGKFMLTSRHSDEGLLDFFVTEYKPSPILSPWNGEGGFLTESGTSFDTIAELRTSTNPRFDGIRSVIQAIDGISALRAFGDARLRSKELEKKKKQSGLSDAEKEDLKEVKSRVKSLKEDILYQIRTEFPDVSLGWLDACLLVGTEGFATAPALGSGGVDGRMEFSANFLANVLLLLDHKDSRSWLEQALFLRGDTPLLETSVGQFAPGSIGGPNATQGFEGGSIVNPWDYVLMIEGAVLLAGTVSRRLNAHAGGKAAFPFTVGATSAGSGTLANSENNSPRGEIWTPLWHRALSLAEVRRLFGEGRAELAGRQSRTAVDFARAASSFGVDRGIESFARFGFLPRSGKNCIATPLGRFEVKHQIHVDLLRDIDHWLDRFRRACTDKAPARFRSALRRIDDAIFDYCRYGERFFQGILIALGQAECELARGAKFRESAWLRPLQHLSSDWVDAADDQSPEYEIASALAGIRGDKDYPGLRFNLEPVEWSHKSRGFVWRDDSAAVAWNRGNLAANLAAVLERRLLDANRHNHEAAPISSIRHVCPATIARFLAADLDDDKIEILLWGLIGCRIEWTPAAKNKHDTARLPLDRTFALLKAVLSGLHSESTAPKNLNSDQSDTFEKLKTVKTETRLLHLLRAGRPQEAATLATQRLRNAGLVPAQVDWQMEPFSTDPTRLAATLLFPVSSFDLLHLWEGVSRKKDHRETISA